MNLLAIYRTETDWCALVAQQERRLTLSYPEEPAESRVLEDGEAAFAAAANELTPLMIDESADADGKRAAMIEQIAALRVFVDAHAEVFADAGALGTAFANMVGMIG